MNLSQIVDIEISGIDTKDHPDYVDAYISSANWKETGKELTEEELDQIKDEHPDFVNQQALESLY